MSIKTETLEQFIENYIQNKVKSNVKRSYEDWVRENGIDSNGIYSDTVRDLTLGYQTGKGGYGAVGENLYGMGLTYSGYSDYVNERAFSDMKKGLTAAKETFDKNEGKNMQGYVEAIEKEQRKFTTVVNSIENAGIADFNSAYEYAVSAGLSDEDAKMVAKAGSDIVRKKLKNSIMKTVVTKKLTKEQTKEYALSLGLTEEEAAELSDYADNINDFLKSPDYYGGYLDYLKDKF